MKNLKKSKKKSKRGWCLKALNLSKVFCLLTVKKHVLHFKNCIKK